MTRRIHSILLLALLATSALAGRKTCIDLGWRFLLDDGSAALTSPTAIQSWRAVDLPHDWSVETEAAQRAGGKVVGPFSSNSVGAHQTGFTVGGTGWYARELQVPAAALTSERWTLYFEGAYNQADVYVNGQHVGFNAYGYSSFRFDVTAALHEGSNLVVVKVANEGNSTRWYAGSGIYRHVWLVRTPTLHIDEWGTVIQTDNATAQQHLRTTLRNDGTRPATCQLCVDIIDANGRTVLTLPTQKKQKVAAGDSLSVCIPFALDNPHRWTPETPYLYTARVRAVNTQTGQADELQQRFGVRTIRFTADRGFLLNGQPTLLRGGCVHHDHGLLGAAAFDRAEERKLSVLKQQGYNAVRTSHGLPSVHFLDACDSIGLMVIDEAFDQWLMEKNHEDYHRYFPQWSDRDVQAMVRRDRNHPSVVMWSIGNEIPGRIEPEGMAAAARLRKDILALDTTRAITAAICSWDAGETWNKAGQAWEIQDERAFESLDVGGYNYVFPHYERDHKTHPDRVMCGTESFPKMISQNWDIVERLPYVIGDFIWTAMDYLGEAGIGSASIRKEGNQSFFQTWPWFNGWCGDIDLIGQKKPQSYYHDVVWRRRPISVAVERPVPEGMHQSISMWGWQLEEVSWTFPEIEAEAPMHVNVYSRAPQVRLYLNGQHLGDQATSDTYWTAFTVPYRPGTLVAVNLDANGNELPDQRFELQTAGKPAALRLVVDQPEIRADGLDLSYVTIELVDAAGRLVNADSSTQVSLSAEGAGTLLASGNGSPNDMESFRSTQPRFYKGRALAILRSTTTAGTIQLKAAAEGLPTATAQVVTR